MVWITTRIARANKQHPYSNTQIVSWWQNSKGEALRCGNGMSLKGGSNGSTRANRASTMPDLPSEPVAHLKVNGCPNTQRTKSEQGELPQEWDCTQGKQRQNNGVGKRLYGKQPTGCPRASTITGNRLP